MQRLGLLEMTYKARNPNSKDLPWLVLDLCPNKKVPNVESMEVQYFSVPSGSSLDQDWKNLQTFFQTKTGFDQVLSGWMTSVNAFGVTASRIAKIFSSSAYPLGRSFRLTNPRA